MEHESLIYAGLREAGTFSIAEIRMLLKATNAWDSHRTDFPRLPAATLVKKRSTPPYLYQLFRSTLAAAAHPSQSDRGLSPEEKKFAD